MLPTPSDVPLTVLVVDDIQENVDLLSELLSEQSYEVTVSNCGKDALDLLNSIPIHVIIADAMMPGVDGFQLCKEVKKNVQLADIPFIIYSGNYLDSEDEQFAKTIGADAYVMKTADLGPLLEVVNNLAKTRYGKTTSPSSSQSQKQNPKLDDQQFLEGHYSMVVKKLEDQMRQLQRSTEILRQQNREILASETRYRNLFERAGIGIFILDRLTGNILDANPMGVEILGYPVTEKLNSTPLPLVETNGFTVKNFLSQQEFLGEALLKTFRGDIIDVDIASGPIVDETQSQLLVFVLDITAHKAVQAQLLQSEKMTLMGRLAAGIAHDIRNPLAALSLNLQYLLKKIQPGSPERPSVEFAYEGAIRISKVIENTLNLARSTPPSLKRSGLNGIVQSCLAFIESSLTPKNLHLESFLTEDLPDIFVEPKQIEQVILNLIQNAIDASPEESKITISTGYVDDHQAVDETEGQQVAFVVLDRGAGVSKEQFKKLFEPFYTTKSTGTGLGLAMAKQIMDKHNGAIRVEPAFGGGTIARLIFPTDSTRKVTNGQR